MQQALHKDTCTCKAILKQDSQLHESLECLISQ